MKKLNKKGFTIVELVIVIAVIGILAGVLIPVFTVVVKKANQSACMQALDTARKEYMTEVDVAEDDFADFDADVTYKYLTDKKGVDYDNLGGFWKYDGDEFIQVDGAYTYTAVDTYAAGTFYSDKYGTVIAIADQDAMDTYLATAGNALYTRAAAVKVTDTDADNANIEIYK